MFTDWTHTHRCKGVSENNTPIRYSYRHLYRKEDGMAWRLKLLMHDYDWDTKYLRFVSEIQYCPYCGEKLEPPIDKE